MPSDVPQDRLRDIISNIDRVRAHLKDMKPAAELDDKTRDAVERCLERISEAAKKLGPIMEERQPQVPWRSIRGLGNVLRHEYDAVDDATIERIVERGLGPLREACVSELALRPGDSPRHDRQHP
jgi:uncharacterized protein with HEPN domain